MTEKERDKAVHTALNSDQLGSGAQVVDKSANETITIIESVTRQRACLM